MSNEDICDEVRDKADDTSTVDPMEDVAGRMVRGLALLWLLLLMWLETEPMEVIRRMGSELGAGLSTADAAFHFWWNSSMASGRSCPGVMWVNW